MQDRASASCQGQVEKVKPMTGGKVRRFESQQRAGGVLKPGSIAGVKAGGTTRCRKSEQQTEDIKVPTQQMQETDLLVPKSVNSSQVVCIRVKTLFGSKCWHP